MIFDEKDDQQLQNNDGYDHNWDMIDLMKRSPFAAQSLIDALIMERMMVKRYNVNKPRDKTNVSNELLQEQLKKLEEKHYTMKRKDKTNFYNELLNEKFQKLEKKYYPTFYGQSPSQL